MEPLATVELVAARIAESIETEEEIALAQSVLAEASAEVRHYGLPWASAAVAPAIAVTITVAAAARGYLNPAGYDMERGDAVTFNRGDSYVTGASLTPQERRMLSTYQRRTGIVSVGMVNTDAVVHRGVSPEAQRGYAPMDDSSKLFPLGTF